MIREIPGILQRVRGLVFRRAKSCAESQPAHFESFIQSTGLLIP